MQGWDGGRGYQFARIYSDSCKAILNLLESMVLLHLIYSVFYIL